jgi:integrase
MARTLGKLPKSYLKLKPGLHADGGNLYLQVSVGREGDRRLSWIFRYRVKSTRRSRDMGLGSADTIGLGAARDRAREYRGLLLIGKDPIAERESERAKNAAGRSSKITFDDCAAQYIEAHEAGWRNDKHRSQWANTLRDYVSPVLGALPIDMIETEHVLSSLKKIWIEKPETASRVRQRIERVLDWARVRGFRQGENPARWKGHLDHLLPAKNKVARVKHHAAMPYRDIPSFMARLSERTDIASKALAFTILTACRTGEVIGARWQEIDLEGRVWLIPPERMKAAREHRVPLSEPALAILRDMASKRVNEFVFPSFDARSRGPLSNMAMSMVLRRMRHGDITTHGFRSAFRDWCGEETSFPREVAEAALAHAIESKTEAAYRRGDALEKRRPLMEAWASYCLPPVDRKVLPLRRTAKEA